MDAILHLCDVVRTLSEAFPPEARPVLLTLDGYKTHTNNLPFIEMARANFVTVICLPLHCSHRMQPHHISPSSLRDYHSSYGVSHKQHRITNYPPVSFSVQQRINVYECVLLILRLKYQLKITFKVTDN